MPNAIPMLGKRFGRLVVVEESGRDKHGNVLWVCKCDCGNLTMPIIGSSLRSGNTRSCGCISVERSTKHGKKQTRLYNIWCCMKQRCYNENHKWFSRYGGRGIAVCEEWKNSFEAFYEWSVANGYSDQLTIDRKDNNRGYCPDNCRWANRVQQCNNKSDVRLVEHGGEIKSLAQLAKEYGIKYQTVYQRYQRGKRGADLVKKA